MNILSIDFAEDIDLIEDPYNGNIDVFVRLDDGYEYVVVIATPTNFHWYMEKEGLDHFCGVPMIIVKALTRDNIYKAIQVYAEDDAYWLKYYHLAGTLKSDLLTKLFEDERAINDSI